MNYLPRLNELAEIYDSKVRFVFVYILEAHASDEWPINNLPEGVDKLDQHKSFNDRVLAATLFRNHCTLHPRIDVLLDSEQNEFNSSYASWPFRCWIIRDGVVQYKSKTDELHLEDPLPTHCDRYGIDANRFENWLESHCTLSNKNE